MRVFGRVLAPFDLQVSLVLKLALPRLYVWFALPLALPRL